ncbi:hypothetical protein [Lysobacter capsici]|uniref:hypothetical protein n=1 Tax=Lysobacter capsici TaxID=435897 RepID=UPI00287BA609|nr:hypothetical protein [Lysobacter capsici]WND80382.1 hypothetical protein RJ610_24430 [Lysobacter capsici]WND85579.1 hypothetical protein RJ609_24450 [Lysobacter capsici]
MNNLADVVLEHYWFLNFCSDEELDPDTAVKMMENLAHLIENDFSDAEKVALQEAAKRSLAFILREPDEHGYTPRDLVTPEQKEFLQAIIDGHFSGPPIYED